MNEKKRPIIGGNIAHYFVDICAKKYTVRLTVAIWNNENVFRNDCRYIRCVGVHLLNVMSKIYEWNK